MPKMRPFEACGGLFDELETFGWARLLVSRVLFKGQAGLV